ncbi:MAG: hypothetical protein WEA56_15370 [Balneolaceae bacterium]
MRILKFISVFLLTALVIFGLVLGLNWKAFQTFLDNRESMMEGSELVENTSSLANLADFIEMYPRYVSVASKRMDQPDSTMLYQEDVPRVMGTSANFFILLAGAMELDAGSMSGDEMIPWDDISRYQLPDVEESVHSQSFNFAAERGWLRDEEITVSKALRLLAEYNSLALADYLWWKINPGTWNELRQELDLEQTDLPLPYSGLYQAISTGLQQQSVEKITARWQDAESDEWRDYVAGLSREYRSESEEREQVREYMSSERLGNTFMEERDAMILFPKTTAGEMLNILEDLWNDEAVNEVVSGRVKDWMRWPMESQPRTSQDFDDYGAIYDSRMGLLNGFDFGTSAYTGNTAVQAVFFDRLPIAFWFHMSANHMHQDFQQRLIIDPAVIERMQEIAE